MSWVRSPLAAPLSRYSTQHCTPTNPVNTPEKLWFRPYVPIAPLRGGHAQTLLGNFWRRPPLASRPEAEAVTVDASEGSRVLCHCHWQRYSQSGRVLADRLTLLVVHGLEGSSNSGYVRGITDLALRAGCNVIRMNMRNCGGTENWTPTLYHSGLSADVGGVLHHFQRRHALTRMAMIGYSMGGNLVLRLAGELGGNAPKWLLAVGAVSPVTDLAESADALHERANRLYERHFLVRLMERFRRKASLYPDRYTLSGLPRIRSIREFDDAIIAPHFGFAGADDYYFRASSARLVDTIGIPTLILHALDDPFIRMRPDTRERLFANPFVRLIESRHGGHCAFLAAKPRQADGDFHRHWAEEVVVRFTLAATTQRAEGERHGG